MTKALKATTQPSPHRLFGHHFLDPTLLEDALTHPSSTGSSQADLRLRYQRLEFLGDAVWSLYVSEALVSLLPTASEGELTLRRASLVSATALAELAQRYDLAPMLCLSKGEESSGGRQKTKVLSSAFEAVIGAIYLDGGADLIRDLAREICVTALKGETLTHDPKTALQQLTQASLRSIPRYRLIRRTGPPHAPMFEVEVMVGQLLIGKGSGASRQEAERAAARDAVTSIPDLIPTISGSQSHQDH